MKCRSGFVSNSSSTSFIIMGTDSVDLINELAKSEGIDLENADFCQGVFEGKHIKFYGFDNETYYAGIDIEDMLENQTLKECRIHFVNLLKNCYNIAVDFKKDDVKMFYGST